MDPSHPHQPACGERRAARRVDAEHQVTVRMRGRFAVAGNTTNLTPAGARIDGAGPFPAGSEMWVRLPGLDSQSGRVVWSHHGATGVCFDHALHPAVYARFLPAESRLALVAPPHAAGFEAVASHPKASGLFGRIEATAARNSENRRAERFDHVTSGPVRLTIDSFDAEVRDVSSNGLRVSSSLAPAVGHKVDVDFEGFETISGEVVWRRNGEIGISLPDDALALCEA